MPYNLDPQDINNPDNWVAAGSQDINNPDNWAAAGSQDINNPDNWVPAGSQKEDTVIAESPASSTGVFLQGLAGLPKNLLKTGIGLVQGGKGASVADQGGFDKLYNAINAENDVLNEQLKKGGGKLIPGISDEDFGKAMQGLPHTIFSMAGGLAGAAAAAPIPVPGTRIAGGLAGSYAVSHRISAYDTMDRNLKKFDEITLRDTGKHITLEQENNYKDIYSADIKEIANWEAGTEAISTMAELALYGIGGKYLPPAVRTKVSKFITSLVKNRMLKGVAANTAKGIGTLVTETAEEVVSGIGGGNVEKEMWGEEKEKWDASTILKTAKEVLPQVAVTAGLVHGAGTIAGKLSDQPGNLKTVIDLRSQLSEDVEKQTELDKDILPIVKQGLQNGALKPDEVKEASIELSNEDPLTLELYKLLEPGELQELDEPDALKPDEMSEEQDKEKIAGVETKEVPLEQIKHSKELPQFKEGADEKGIVEPLTGKYERVGTSPIVLWERKNGDLEIMTGRHRYQLALGQGEETIPAQVLKEADGFTAEQAAILDVESNIRDEKGSVRDYATYFRETETTEEQASSRGLLSRAKGQNGFIIGRNAEDDLYSAYRNKFINEKKTVAIAKAVPGNSDLQNVGMKYADKHTADEIKNYLQAVKTIKATSTGDQTSFFSGDESWQIEADKMAKTVTQMEQEAKQERMLLKSVSKLDKKKHKELLDKYGISIGDTQAVKDKVQELDERIQQLDNWAAHPNVVADVKKRAGVITDDKSQIEEAKGSYVSETTGGIILATKKTGKTKYPKVVSNRRRRYLSHTAHVKNSGDAAAFADHNLSQFAQERLVALLLGDDGKILGAHKFSAGSTGSAPAQLGIIAGQALNTKGVKEIILIHNHPSGDPTLSSPDVATSNQLASLMSETKITASEIIAVAGDKYASNLSEGIHAIPKTGKATVRVPMLVRVFETKGEELQVIANSEAVSEIGKKLLPKGGLFFLDGRHAIVGTMRVNNYSKLRGETAREILKQTEKVNATTIIAFDPDASSTKIDAKNLQKFANAAQMKLLDVVRGDKSTHGQEGMPATKETIYFEDDKSVKDPPLTTKTIKKTFGKMKNVTTGQNKQGNFWFHFKGFPRHTILEVDDINGRVGLTDERQRTGAFLPDSKQIWFKTGGAGAKADTGSLHHENWHLFKKMGVVSAPDIRAVKRAIRRKGNKGTITEEMEASFIGDAAKSREYARETRIGRILQKISDFLDAMINLVAATSKGVVRKTESGKIAGQKVEAGKQSDGVPAMAFEQTAARFYSRVIKSVETKMPAKMQASSVMNWLKKQPGVKAAELEWMNIEEMLEDKKSVSRDELVELLKTNQVVVEEVVRGGEDEEAAYQEEAERQFDESSETGLLAIYNRLKEDISDETTKAWDDTNHFIWKAVKKTKKELIKEEGGDAELGFDEFERIVDRLDTEELWTEETIEMARDDIREERFDEWEEMNRDRIKEDFNQPKFSQYQLEGEKENYREFLFKLLVKQTERVVKVLRDGKTVAKFDTYIAAQDYLDDHGRAEYKIVDSAAESEAAIFRSMHWGEPNVFAHTRVNERTDADGNRVLFVEEIQSDWEQAIRKGEKVPDMPFKKNWHEVVLKRIIRMAAEQGIDKVSWITGQQTADRYDLSKHLSEIHYSSSNLVAFDPEGNEVIQQTGIMPEDLEQYIGKELAKRLMAVESANGLRSLTGLDLKIGGGWAYNLYDKMIPQFLKKFGKKYKAQVGATEINGNEQQSFTITPQLRQAALSEGMSLFEMAGEFGVSTEQLKKEFEKVKSKYKGTDEWLKAPNGKKSNLNEHAWVMTRTPQFKKWFGDSKVVDANGEPATLYHATAKMFTAFDVGRAGTGGLQRSGKDKVIFFTDDITEAKDYLKSVFDIEAWYTKTEKYQKLADNLRRKIHKKRNDEWESYRRNFLNKGFSTKESKVIADKKFKVSAKDVEKLKGYNRKAKEQIDSSVVATGKRRIIKTYLSMDNPITYDVKGRVTTNRETVKRLHKQAIRNGNDGIILKNVKSFSPDDPPTTHYVVFNPAQIKSIYNAGGFDPANADIRFETKDVGLTKEITAETAKSKGFAETLTPVTEADFLENRENKGNFKLAAKATVRRAAAEIVEGTDKFLGSISTRLGNVSEKIKFKVRQLDSDINKNYATDVGAVQPLLNKAKKMSKNDFIDWDYARKNSVTQKIDELIEKYDMQKEYDAYRKTLSDIRKEGIDVGLAIGEIEEYAPRVLKDDRGFLAEIGKPEFRPLYSDKLREHAREMGTTVEEMPLDVKANLISNIILGGWTGMSGISATKQRKLKKIPPHLNKFYMHSDAALMQHLYSMRKGIEARKFFGKIPEKVAEIRTRLRKVQRRIKELGDLMGDKEKFNELKSLEKHYLAYLQKYAMQRDYTENIGAYIAELIKKGEVEGKDERVVNEILNARFHEAGTRGLIQAYKNLSYIDTMGSPVSALTQIGDLAWAFYEGGVIPTLKNAYKSFRGQSRITKESVGLTNIAQEFADPGTLQNAVTWVFKVVGLEKMDSIGKESLLNTAHEKYQKEAKKDPAKLKKKIEPIFENETDSVIDDLLNDEISENVKLLVYNRLLDFQPVALSEMPQVYLSAGNGRLFYMLKTFTLKSFDVFRNEAYNKIKSKNKSERIEGVKNLIKLASFFVLANAGADELKDFVLGRKTDFSDQVTDNILRLFGVSKFVTWKARTEGVGSALSRQILPPFKFVDSLGKDIINVGDEKGLEVIGSIPILGKLAYWHLGRGTSKREDLWDRRWRKHKAGLNKTKDRLETAKDKNKFRREHRKEFRGLHEMNKMQGHLNRLKKRINWLKSLDESKNTKLRIQKLGSARTRMIKNFLSK